MEQKSSVNIGPALKWFLVKNFNGPMFLAIPHVVSLQVLKQNSVNY